MSGLVRYLVYRAEADRHYMCVCAARNREHALKIARQNFRLTTTAYAVPEKGGRGEKGSIKDQDGIDNQPQEAHDEGTGNSSHGQGARP